MISIYFVWAITILKAFQKVHCVHAIIFFHERVKLQ